ncbi:hypothetical protein yc1106_00895 [Curvularia clavata]|uniref:NACHT-NTPase and P-loop NTPases N-terminal domain-containing protein n=1 Tax=Curvularia clavata TaxID=95742 RepID=A0A9Q8Z0I6_CURCL|nr:hypothetical protein yc1106_00895 [Curvularia clavata]
MEAFGAAANIISVIHITCEVIQRLKDFRNSIQGLPKSLETLSFELPVLKDCLDQIERDLQNGQIQNGDDRSLYSLLKAFELSLQRLSDIIQKMRPESESAVARNMKALTSFQFDSEVDRIREDIRGYTATLNLKYAIRSSIAPVAKQPPKPRFTSPFSRDIQFVDRPILDELLTLQCSGSRYAIVGEGGIGKSQIAIEYGYRIHQKAPKTWVFWVDAESINTFEQSYREIANTLMLHGEANVFSLVSNWLRDETNGDWVMILDNADDKNVLCSHPKQDAGLGDPKQLKEYIPQSMNGSVLVTSRSRDSAFEITCNYKNIKTIEPMGKEEGLSLLRCYLADAHQDEDMEMLLEAVDNIPLAISHAGSYITKRGIPIKSYLQELQKENGKGVSLQEGDITQFRREAKRGNSVVKTWIVTFDHIRITTPSAARLLSLMCLFARQSIPESLLQGNYGRRTSTVAKRKSWWKRRFQTRRKQKEQPTPVAPDAPSRTVGDDLLTLRDFNLIKKNNGADEFSMHALVQLATKRWLDQNKELSFWSERFIVILEDHLSKNRVTDFSTFENLFQHAAAAISDQPCDTSREPLIAWASLATKVAAYCNNKSAFKEQQLLHRAAADAYASTLGVDAPETIECLVAEAQILLHMGQIAESEVVFRRILRIQQLFLSPEHLDILKTKDQIMDTLARQSRTAEAEELYAEILDIRTRVYGIAHPKTQDFLTWRGYNLVRDMQYAEAYTVWKRAAQARSSPRDMAWIEQLDSLGIRLEMDGQPDLAERYFRESLAEKQRIFTEDMADSDIDYVCLPKGLLKLGRNLCIQKKWSEAEPLLQKSFAWFNSPRRKTDGEQVGARQENMYFLAVTLEQVDLLEQAENLCRLFLSENDEAGSGQGRYMVEWFWLSARVLERSQKFEDAMRCYEIAFNRAVEMMGVDHEETKSISCNYKLLADKICKQNDTISNKSTGSAAKDTQSDEHQPTRA